MQKKDRGNDSSNWQDNIKKQERNSFIKKVILWSAVIAICVTGLAALVIYADKSTSGTTDLVENANLPKVSENDIVLGNKNAKVTITEYADYQCPACASYNPVINRLLEEYKDKIQISFRFFPLKNIHKNAQISGQAAYAAHKMGKFSEMKDLLYENQKDWETLGDPKETFEGYASSLELDVEEFKTLMNSDEAKNAVNAGEREAMSLGLQSTPTFFFGNKQFSPRTYEDFKKLIDEELNKQKPLQ